MRDLDLDQDHLNASLVSTVFEAQVHLLEFSLKTQSSVQLCLL